jgi:CheY-like chemotaxis protein
LNSGLKAGELVPVSQIKFESLIVKTHALYTSPLLTVILGNVATYSIRPTEENAKKKRILLVDDELDITLSLKIALEESGFLQVEAFYNPVLALSRFKAGAYDLALLDIKMPEIDGFELYRKLREIDNKLKICFLTAAELGHYRETGSDIMDELGKEYFVAKPVNTIDLIDRLEVILSQE